MALKSVCFIKASPGTGYVLGQVIYCKDTGSVWSDKETGAEQATPAGLTFNVVDLDLTQEQIDNIDCKVDGVPIKYKVNDVDNPTSVVVV
jgi:hypothetical protein